MTETFHCGDNTALVAYLYDECEPEARRAIETHVAVCAACAAELAVLGSTRLQLASWTPPEAVLGYRIVSEAIAPNVVRSVPWWTRPIPAWAQAAAAGLIFGVGVWLGVAGGRAASEAPAAAVPAVNTASTTDLTALERRLRTEMAQLRASTPSSVGATSLAASEAQLLARVSALIDESGQRQQRELALRTAQVARDFETQRRVDLAQIQRTFGVMEGQTGAEARDHREMLDYLRRVSQQQR